MSTNINTWHNIGNREGLTDRVADLFADDVPLMAMSRKVPAIATKHEWQSDNLNAASTTPITEGASVSYSQPTYRTRNNNYTHIRLRSWDVTHTQLAVSIAGITDEAARQMMKSMKELMTDYEKIFLSTGAASAGSSASGGRQAAGLGSAITTNSGAGTGTAASASIALTEAKINARLQEIWDAGGDPSVLFCGGYNKRVISNNFTAKTGFSFNIDASARQAIANINSYEGSFGTLQVVPDRFCPGQMIYLTTPDQIKIAVLRDIERYEGGKTTSSVRGWVEAEMTLEWGNEKAHARNNFLKTTGVSGV